MLFEYLHKEIEHLKQDRRYFKEHPNESRDRFMFCKLVALLAAIICMLYTMPAQAAVKVWEPKVEWKCPSCGYDNYESIRYCPLCASERG